MANCDLSLVFFYRITLMVPVRRHNIMVEIDALYNVIIFFNFFIRQKHDPYVFSSNLTMIPSDLVTLLSGVT